MAGTKNPAVAAATSLHRRRRRRRPFNTPIMLAFLLISAGSLWVMRIDTALHDVPREFASQVESGQLSGPVFFSSSSPSSPPHPYLRLRKRYTGVSALDEVLAFLVAAFLAGPAAGSALGDPGVRLQQLHFLVSFYAVAAVWAVEACRTRHARRRSVAWTALWALLYQTVGAAVIAPLFCVAHLAASAGDDGVGGNERARGGGGGRDRGQQQLRPGYARALLPATALGYLGPTLAMYAHGRWGGDLYATQGLIAFWQPAPLLVEVLLVLFAALPIARGKEGGGNDNNSIRSDLPHLKRLYLFAAVVPALAHFGTLYRVFFSAPASAATSIAASDDTLSNRLAFFAHVFLPSRATWRDSTALGLHWIFQWDWWGVVAASLLWCWVVACDVLRLLRRHSSRDGNGSGNGRNWWPWLFEVGAVGAAIGAVAVVAGPGTAVAAVWSWRESKLVLLEEGGQAEGGDGAEAGKRKVA